MVWNPTGSGEVHIDVALTNFSAGYQNNTMVAERLMPVVNVGKRSNKYYKFGREGWLPEDDIRAAGAVAREITPPEVSTDSYYADEHSLQIPVTDEERDAVDNPFDPDMDGTRLVTEKVMLKRERTVQTLATTTGNYASGHSTTLSGTQQWNDYANSDPIGDLRTGVRTIHSKIFVEPNRALIPYTVMSFLADHPDFLERIKYSERAIFDNELLAAVLGFQEVIVPGAGFNTAPLGQAENFDYIWGKDVVLAFVTQTPGLKIRTYGYEFQWKSQTVDRWREAPRKSDLIRVSRYYDHKFITTDSSDDIIAGYLIKDAVN